MKLSELMKGYEPKESYEGWVTNDDYVFAIDTAPGAATPTEKSDYAVVEMGIAGLDAQLNPVTQDKQYIRSGQSTTKTGTQRSFAVTGDRYASDEAQDFCLSHKMKYGTGNGVITNYVYFNILNGKGEEGQCESSAIDIEFRKIGANPKEYAYTASGSQPLEAQDPEVQQAEPQQASAKVAKSVAVSSK